MINLSKNLKEIDHPNRWNIMVAFLPDVKYHIPSALWYFLCIFLFFEVFNFIKSANTKQLKTELNRSANVLIFYPILSIFLVVSIGSGLEAVINQNLKPPRIIDIISSPNIYLPLVVFIILVIISIFLRKMFYKK